MFNFLDALEELSRRETVEDHTDPSKKIQPVINVDVETDPDTGEEVL